MPIQQTSKGNADSFMEKIARIQKAFNADFVEAGLQAQREARLRHSYKDQTGNLTSSMGFVAAYKGSVLGEGGGTLGTYASVNGATVGTAKAQALAQEEAGTDTDKMKVAVFAAMPYAKFVEAKGYCVLETAKRKLREELKKNIQDTIRMIANGR